MYEELQSAMSPDDDVTENILQNIPYVKAVVKESMRYDDLRQTHQWYKGFQWGMMTCDKHTNDTRVFMRYDDLRQTHQWYSSYS